MKNIELRVVISSLLEEGLREVTVNHPLSPIQRREINLTSKKIEKNKLKK